MYADGKPVYADAQWTDWRLAMQLQHQYQQQWRQQHWISDENEKAWRNWYAANEWSRSQPSAASLEHSGSGMPANDQHWFGPSEMQLERERQAAAERERQAAAFAYAVSVPASLARAKAKGKASGNAASSPKAKAKSKPKAKAKSSPDTKAKSSSDDEAALPPTPTQRSQPSAASSSSDSSQPSAARRSISALALEQVRTLHRDRLNERNAMTPAPRFEEPDEPAFCGIHCYPIYGAPKLLAGTVEAEPAAEPEPCGTNDVPTIAWLDDGAEALCAMRVYPIYGVPELLAGSIEAEPAPCGTNVVPTVAWLDDGAEVEPAVGGMSLQSQPMPGSHPLLGQRPLPVPAVWPALEALSEDTQLIIMKFAYSGDFVIQAEEQRYLKQTLSTLKLALLDGDSIELLPPHIIDWYNIYDQTYAAPALGGALAWLGAEDEVEPAVGGADADEAEPALGGADVEPALNIDVDFGGRVYDERAQFIRHRWFRAVAQYVWMRHHASLIAWKRVAVARKQRQALYMRKWAFFSTQTLIRRATNIATSTKRQLSFTRFQ